MKHEELTHKIISCAYKVHNTLGFGFLESVYKKGMVIELTKSMLKTEEEKPLKVYYDNQVVGDFYIDLLVEDEMIIELKSVENLAKSHAFPSINGSDSAAYLNGEVQFVNYLNGLKKIGFLIYFGLTGVDVKRKYRKNIGQD